jgi:hypothetical protein
MTDILEELELRQVNTLVNLPKDKRQWPITVTAGELDALIRVVRAAEVLRYAVSDHLRLDEEECWKDLAKPERDLNEALQQLRDVGTADEHRVSGEDRT